MPPRDLKAFLLDVRDACDAVLRFVEGVERARYDSDLMLRSAVERQLMIVGEAVNHIRRLDPLMADTLGDVDGIVTFRNIIVHGYFHVKNDLVWSILQSDISPLRAAVRSGLLARGWNQDAPGH